MWLLAISAVVSVFFFTNCAISDSSSLPTPPSLAGPIVEVEQGKLEGFTFDLEFWPDNLPQVDNTTRITSADIFLGIPYAQPPVDQLRLEKPLPPNKWDGVLKSTEVASSCVPLHLLASFDYSEDCLFVNVFRPSAANGNSKVKYPVLVFIHGGGFSLGGSFVEGYRNLSHNFVSQGIVVVTIQYRLGLFGFFSDGSAELPGNLGLWDQAQALAWIQKNIKVFGGDPNNVTVWGQSAGSASVSMLSISRHSRDLFHQTIQQSGSWLSPWALNNRVVNTSISSANILNCSTESSKELKQCIKDLPLEDIVFGIAEIEMVRGEFEIIVYNPRPDGDFFDAPLEQLTKESHKKPTIIGFTTDEGMFLTTEYPDSVFAFQSPLTVEDNKLFGEKDLISRIQAKVIPKISNGNKKSVDSIKKEVIQFYTGKANATAKAKRREFPFYLQHYTQLLSDVLFIIPALWEARLKAENDWPVYLFQFDYINKEMQTKSPFKGVIHGAEYPFAVGVHIFGTYEMDQEDYIVRNTMITAFGNFIKTSNPSTQNLRWPLLKKGDKLKNVHIGVKSFVETEAKHIMERLHFWDSLSSKHNFSQIQGFPTLQI